jgi:signal peptidase I
MLSQWQGSLVQLKVYRREPDRGMKQTTIIYLQKKESMLSGENTSWTRFLIGRYPAWTLVRVSMLILSSILIFKYGLTPIRVTGNSMEPTCYDGQISVLNGLAFFWHPPKRGDIVGFQSDNGGQIIIKRIIGLPGERIAFHSGVVYINSNRIAEPYVTSQGAWEWPEEKLGEKFYFVTGDNRVISQQFRVESTKILGKAYVWRP